MMHKTGRITINRCPLCRSTELRKICNKTFYIKNLGGEVINTYSICTKCFFVFTQDPLNSSSLKKYYKNNMQERLPHADNRETAHMLEQITFMKNSVVFQNASVLEVGANNGSFLEMCKKNGASPLRYLEMSEEGLSLLKKKTYLLDFNKIVENKRKESLDIIVLLHTLEHIVKPFNFIKKFASYLKDGGIFLIEVPDFTFHDQNTDEFIFEHVNYFAEATLRKLFVMNGFDVIHSQITIDREYPVCPKYTVRMVVKKNAMQPKTPSSFVAKFCKHENGKKHIFKKIDSYIKSLDPSSVLGIYTASWLTIECLKNTKFLGKKAVAIFDRDTKKQGKSICNLHIYNPKELLKLKIDKILILNDGYENEIRTYLKKIGYSGDKVVGWSEFI